MKVARVFGNVLEILGGILVSPGSGECIPPQRRGTKTSLHVVAPLCEFQAQQRLPKITTVISTDPPADSGRRRPGDHCAVPWVPSKRQRRFAGMPSAVSPKC